MGMFFLLIWFILFSLRKDVRREMLIMSLIFGFCGPLADSLYYKDWWLPLTIMNTTVSFEAFIVGFCLGGIIAVIYEETFKDRLKIKRENRKERKKEFSLFIITLILIGLIFFGTYYIFDFNSLYATIFAMLIPTLFIWIKRRDLIKVSLISGLLTLSAAIAVYSILIFIAPNWITFFYKFKNVPAIVLFNVPIDDFIWYFLGGCLVAPLYPFWVKGKLIRI